METKLKTENQISLKEIYQNLDPDSFGKILEDIPKEYIKKSLERNEITLTSIQTLKFLSRYTNVYLKIRPGNFEYNFGRDDALVEEIEHYKERYPDNNEFKIFYGQGGERVIYDFYAPYIFSIYEEDNNELFSISTASLIFSSSYETYLFLFCDIVEWQEFIDSLKENKDVYIGGERNYGINSDKHTYITYEKDIFEYSVSNSDNFASNINYSLKLNNESRKQFVKVLKDMMKSIKTMINNDPRRNSFLTVVVDDRKKHGLVWVEANFGKKSEIKNIVNENDVYEIEYFDTFDAIKFSLKINERGVEITLGKFFD